MTLDASGNLGLGITSPASYSIYGNKFVLGGNSNYGMTIVSGTSSYGALFFADGTSGADAYRGFIQYNHSGDNFEIGTNGSERMRITSGGQVLINTTTATSGGVYHPLIVKGTGTSSQGIWVEAYSNDAAIFLDHSGTVGKIGTSYRTSASYTPLVFETSGAERMRITSGGDVGIGTTSPTEKLSVARSGTTSGEVLSVGNTGTGQFGGLAVSDGGSYPVRMWAPQLEFLTGNSSYASATERMRITSGGNVGIGTTSPGDKLEVNGNVYATAFHAVGRAVAVVEIS